MRNVHLQTVKEDRKDEHKEEANIQQSEIETFKVPNDPTLPKKLRFIPSHPK